MKGFGAVKIVFDIIMIVTAIFLIMKGLDGSSIEPFMLIIIGVLILGELATDLLNMH